GVDRGLRTRLLLVGRREVAPRARVVRIARGLLLEARDRGSAARAEVEHVLKDVAHAGRAGADAEQHEAEDERDGEADVRALGMRPEPLEEQLLLPLGRLAPLGRSYRCGASIR